MSNTQQGTGPFDDEVEGHAATGRAAAVEPQQDDSDDDVAGHSFRSGALGGSDDVEGQKSSF